VRRDPACLHFPSLLFHEASPEVWIGGDKQVAKSQGFIYALVGAGDLALERLMKTRAVVERARSREVYDDVVTRGRKLSTRIQRSAPSKQAAAQTKAARAQLKAATTSLGKAVQTNAYATRSAVSKLARAS
jgi:hypothetical protein